jgi:hypothetical protein
MSEFILNDVFINNALAIGHAFDYTEYAKSNGYSGKKPVIVIDGKVASHRWKDWFEFCEQTRQQTSRTVADPSIHNTTIRVAA